MSACVLPVLVVLVATIDGQGHSPYHQHNSCSSNKEDRIASQHRQLSSKVASPDGHSLGWLVCIVVVLAAQDTGACVVVTKARKLNEALSTLVAESRITSVTSHVIAARRSLDVDLAKRTLLTVGDAIIGAALGPLEELFVSLLELSTAHVSVPWCVTPETPFTGALFTGYLNVFFPEPSGPRGKLVFSNVAAVRAGLLGLIVLCFQSHLLVQISGSSSGVLQDFFPSDHSILALWVWACNEDKTLFNVCVDDGGDAGTTNCLLATWSLFACSIDSVVANDARILVIKVNVSDILYWLDGVVPGHRQGVQAVVTVCRTKTSGQCQGASVSLWNTRKRQSQGISVSLWNTMRKQKIKPHSLGPVLWKWWRRRGYRYVSCN